MRYIYIINQHKLSQIKHIYYCKSRILCLNNIFKTEYKHVFNCFLRKHLEQIIIIIKKNFLNNE